MDINEKLVQQINEEFKKIFDIKQINIIQIGPKHLIVKGLNRMHNEKDNGKQDRNYYRELYKIEIIIGN